MDDASFNKSTPASTPTVIALRARREAFQIATAVAIGRWRPGDPVACVECGNRFTPGEGESQKHLCPSCDARRKLPPLRGPHVPVAISLSSGDPAAMELVIACEQYLSRSASLDNVRQAIWAYIRALPAAWHVTAEMTRFVVEIDEVGDGPKARDVMIRLIARLIWLHPNADQTSPEDQGTRLAQIAEAVLSAIAQCQRREISLAGVRTALRGYIDALAGRAPVTQVMQNYLLDLKESEFGEANAIERRTFDLLDSLTQELRVLHGVSNEGISVTISGPSQD